MTTKEETGILTANNAYPVRLRPGEYKFTEPVMVTRFQGSGDSRRSVEYWTVEEFVVPHSVNQFCFGVELLSSEIVDGFAQRDVLASYAPNGNNR